MSAASKKSKTQQLKERWENGELDCGAMTPEFIKGLSPRELGMLGELITIDYFNERGYTLLEQGYRCTEGEADLVLLDELDDVVVMAEVKTRRVALDCSTRVFPEEAVDAQKQRRYRRIASCYLMGHPRRAYCRDRAPVQRVRLAGVVMAFETFAVHAACIRGVEAIHVTVEVSLAGGVPGIQMLGIPSMEVMESRGRIRCAMRSAGFEIPRSGITVNLAPGDIRKTGSGFDLPIAIAVLAADGQIPRDNLDRCLIAGELGLDGTVLPVKGEVAFQLLARDMGLSFIAGRSDQHVPLAGVDCGIIDHLSQLAHGMGDAARHYLDSEGVEATFEPELDYADVLGQEVAKRGMALAAAGELGLLMIGSPGSGKTMLARRMTGILPELSVEDQQEALCIHSVLGENIDGLLAGHRPFRSPHHSISTAGLIGGGRPVHPGEISLAHGGVLFLDELAEFPTGVLQTLRQPIERGYVRIVRVDGAFTFPSRFQLLAASNPCPCGFLGDREVPCRCSAAMVERYRSKLRGPLADRIDMMIDVTRPDPQVIIEGAEGMSSAELRDYVVRGRAFRAWRESRMDDADAEAEDDETRSIDGVVSTFELDDAAEKCVLGLSKRTHLTGRGIVRLVRIARTIADVAESEQVTQDHVLEAAMYQGRRDQ